MKKKTGNPVWNFFASVKLALFTLFTLAIFSIIGTIVPQNEDPHKYIELYGESTAKIFQTLGIPDMYSSWWFVGLLILFSLNLTVCTIERFPHLWRVMTKDYLRTTAADRLRKMSGTRVFASALDAAAASGVVERLLAAAGWKAERVDKDGGIMFFSQKGAWTRMGVIVVHVSILVIFAGSLIGNFYGYKASVMIPEGSYTDQVYDSKREGHPPIPLDFRVRCNGFWLTYYDNGMPKDYISHLVVEENGQKVVEKTIEVNDPLKYKGLTFYQSSYQAIDGQYVVNMTNKASGDRQKFIIVPRKENRWQSEKVSFGIVDIAPYNMMGQYKYKIWFNDAAGSPTQFWVPEGQTVAVKRPGATYEVTVKTRFATGMQVVKDPGVWTVYSGCIMMILGLIVIFFMAHRRVWAFVRAAEGGSEIVLAGSSNKNKLGFEKIMADLGERFASSSDLKLQ